jgi:hypothetical protein
MAVADVAADIAIGGDADCGGGGRFAPVVGEIVGLCAVGGVCGLMDVVCRSYPAAR